MSDLNENALPEAVEAQAPKQCEKKKKKQRSGILGRFVRRTLLLLFTLVLLTIGGLALFLDTIFTGPSDIARKELTMTLLEYPATDWIPGIFLDEAEIDLIRSSEG